MSETVSEVVCGVVSVAAFLEQPAKTRVAVNNSVNAVNDLVIVVAPFREGVLRGKSIVFLCKYEKHIYCPWYHLFLSIANF